MASQQQQPHFRPNKSAHLANVIRPSPIPANAPTEQEILRGGPHSHPGHQHQHRLPHLPQHAPDLLQLINNHPLNVGILQRAEAQALQIAVDQHHVSPQVLLQQFAHGNLQPLQREILLQVLKVQQNNGRLPTSLTPQMAQHLSLGAAHQPPQHHTHHQQQQHHPGISPRTSPLSEHPMNMAVMHQHQQRLSPSAMFPGQQPGGKSSLTVSPVPGQQRIPSPQELVYHTQQIMQNALIKRKLEEQRENFRRRQEEQQQQSQQHAIRERSNSDPKTGGTDSPLNFTPTAVMKKMAAERRDSDPRPQIPELRVSHSIESGMSGAGGPGGDDVQQRFQNLKIDEHRTSPISPHNVPIPPPNPLAMMNAQAAAAAMQQAQAAQAMQLAAAQRGGGSGRIPPDPRMLPGAPGSEQMLRGFHPQAAAMMRGPVPGGNGGPGPGGLSQFFSPEVLAQAQSGNAPSMPPLPTQKAMTLEEIERQAAAVRI